MPCTSYLASGFTACNPSSSGGIAKLYIASTDAITGITSANSIISVIGMASGAKFYEFSLTNNTSSFSEARTVSVESGSAYIEQSVELVLNYRESAKREVIEALGSNLQKLTIIIKDSNDNYFVLGESRGLILTTNTGGSGKALGDANQYVLGFVGQEKTLAKSTTSGVVLGLI